MKRSLCLLLPLLCLLSAVRAQYTFEGELTYQASSFGIKSTYTEWHKRGDVAAGRPMSSEIIVYKASEDKLYTLKDEVSAPKEETLQNIVVGTAQETVKGRQCVKVTYEMKTQKSVIYREEWVDPSVDAPYHYGHIPGLTRGIVVKQTQKITGKGHPAIKTTSTLQTIHRTTVPSSRFALK